MDDEKIEVFIEKVCKYVALEERARDIADELRDHIMCKIEESEAEGQAPEKAVDAVLAQMGDVEKLSEQYKVDMPNNALKQLIAVSIGFIIILGMMVVSSLGRPTLFGGLANICILGGYMTMFIGAIRDYCAKRKKYKCEDVLFYVRQHKNSPSSIKIVKGIMIFFSLAVFLCMTLEYQLGQTFEAWLVEVSGLLPLEISYCVFIFTLPYNKGATIYKEGILLAEGFIGWDQIIGYRWERHYNQQGVSYTLQLKLKNKNKQAILSKKKWVQVSEVQHRQITRLMETKAVPYCTYM